MIPNLYKRGSTYHYQNTLAGSRIRCSLGTHNPKAAERLVNRIIFATCDGPKSPVWGELKRSLPASSFDAITSTVGVAVQPDLHEFEQQFLDHLDRRVKLGELTTRSRDLYETAAKRFFLEMARYSIRKMDSITSGIVDDYCVWRQEDIQAKGGSGRGMLFETTVLSLIFNYAVQERVIPVSPLKRRPKPDAEPKGAEPFTPEEIAALDRVQKDPQESLIYLLFKWTGLRVSDVTDLRWDAINWDDHTLLWRTKKRGKTVTIPIVAELYRALRSNYLVADDKVLPDYGTKRLYTTIKRIGDRAGVKNVHPHRISRHNCGYNVGKRRNHLRRGQNPWGYSGYGRASLLSVRVTVAGTGEKHLGTCPDNGQSGLGR